MLTNASRCRLISQVAERAPKRLPNVRRSRARKTLSLLGFEPTPRGELELELAGKRLTFEGSKKEYETAQKKARGTTAALQAIKDDIHVFQLQKLARLNELEVAVSLKLSQLQMLENQRLPADTSAGLVFWDSELERLAVRIDQLYTETAEEKAKRRASYKEERRLKQDCKLMETYIEKLQKQSVTEMKKKFGRLVDLEELESLMVNETVEELRIRLEGEQRLVDSERADRKERLSHLRRELISVIKDNTHKVGVIQMLKDEKRHLDKGLNFVRKAGIAPHDNRLDDALEIQNLMNTISLQKTQIMELKQEIWALSVKSRPHRDPCRRVSTEPGREPSYDELTMLESQCSEEFLAQLGLEPGSGDSHPPADGSLPHSADSGAPPAGRSSTTAPSGGTEVLPSAGSESAVASGNEQLQSGAEDVGTETKTGQDGAGEGVALEKDKIDAEETEMQPLSVTEDGRLQGVDQSLGVGLQSGVQQSLESGDKGQAEAADEGPPDTVTAETPAVEGTDAMADAEGREQPPDVQAAPPDVDSASAGGALHSGGAVDGSVTTGASSLEYQESGPGAAQQAAGGVETPADGEGYQQ